MYEKEFLYKAWKFSLAQDNLDFAQINPAVSKEPYYIPVQKPIKFAHTIIQAAENPLDSEEQPRRLYIYNTLKNELAFIYEPENLGDSGITLPVLYSQIDKRWASYKLSDKKTLGNWGCLLVAYNMLAAYWGLTDLEPDKFTDLAYKRKIMYRQYVRSMGLAKMYPEVKSHGWKVKGEPLEQKIKEWVDSGKPVPARVDLVPATARWEQHWVLIIDYTDTDWIAADPIGGEIIKVAERYGIRGRDILEGLFYTID